MRVVAHCISDKCILYMLRWFFTCLWCYMLIKTHWLQISNLQVSCKNFYMNLRSPTHLYLLSLIAFHMHCGNQWFSLGGIWDCFYCYFCTLSFPLRLTRKTTSITCYQYVYHQNWKQSWLRFILQLYHCKQISTMYIVYLST